jgi:hypothetical protein
MWQKKGLIMNNSRLILCFNNGVRDHSPLPCFYANILSIVFTIVLPLRHKSLGLDLLEGRRVNGGTHNIKVIPWKSFCGRSTGYVPLYLFAEVSCGFLLVIISTYLLLGLPTAMRLYCQGKDARLAITTHTIGAPFICPSNMY